MHPQDLPGTTAPSFPHVIPNIGVILSIGQPLHTSNRLRAIAKTRGGYKSRNLILILWIQLLLSDIFL